MPCSRSALLSGLLGTRKGPVEPPAPAEGGAPGSSRATAVALPLTRRGRLELGLLLGVGSAEHFGRGLLPSLDLALEGKQVLNILLFQGARCAA